MGFFNFLKGKQQTLPNEEKPNEIQPTEPIDKSSLIQNYNKEVQIILSEKYTGISCSLSEWEVAALKLVYKLERLWKGGDLDALQVLQKIIRREFDVSNFYKEQFQKMVLEVMVANPELFTDPLLSMLRDDSGNLVFPKNSLTYLYYPSKVLRTLQEIALNGFETKKLVYEFIRIGTRLEMEIPNYKNLRDAQCSYALANINQRLFNKNDSALLESIPALNNDEKKYLIDHHYKINETEI